MKIDDARRQILAEWEVWRKGKESDSWSTKFAFYNWLTHEGVHLLDFHCHGDKWQRVSGWIG